MKAAGLFKYVRKLQALQSAKVHFEILFILQLFKNHYIKKETGPSR